LQQALRRFAEENLRQAKLRLETDQRAQALALVTQALAVLPDNPEALRLYAQASQPLPPRSPAMARFLEGNMPGALKLAQTCAPPWPSCRTELAALKELSTLYRKRENPGSQDLVRMVELDKQLTGHQSPSRLTNGLITALRQQAKELYLLCYALKDTDPEQSKRKFRQVMAMTLPDDELHQKAKAWLDKLKR
jgi:tetratricopeptide (TPR) repeat protein